MVNRLVSLIFVLFFCAFISFIAVNGKASDSSGADSEAFELHEMKISNARYFKFLSIK